MGAFSKLIFPPGGLVFKVKKHVSPTYNSTDDLPRDVTIFWLVYAKGTNPNSWVKRQFYDSIKPVFNKPA